MLRQVAVVTIAFLATVIAGISNAPPAEAQPNLVLADGSECWGNAEVTLTTNYGELVGEFFLDKVPITAGNFVKLADDGYYNGTVFHRAIKDFMIQGGDYTMGNGRGGEAHPEYANGAGNIPDEYDSSLLHRGAGKFSMANAGPGTGSSQFFITFVDTPWLDGKHSVFGQITDGFTVLDAINANAARSDQNGVPPLTQLNLVSATARCL